MIQVNKDALGSDTTVLIKREAMDEVLWTNLAYHLGYKHIDKTDNTLELTVIGSNLYHECQICESNE